MHGRSGQRTHVKKSSIKGRTCDLSPAWNFSKVLIAIFEPQSVQSLRMSLYARYPTAARRV
jgi:hypothetical protein